MDKEKFSDLSKKINARIIWNGNIFAFLHKKPFRSELRNSNCFEKRSEIITLFNSKMESMKVPSSITIVACTVPLNKNGCNMCTIPLSEYECNRNYTEGMNVGDFLNEKNISPSEIKAILIEYDHLHSLYATVDHGNTLYVMN